MKKIILILITILTSTIITSQVRFNYIKWNKEYGQEDSTGLIYYTSDPDTTLVEAKRFKASIIYHFDNEGETVRFIPVYKTKVKKEEVIYLGKWENKLYKMTYNKKYGDFTIKKRALLPNYRTIMYFHRDYDYYDQLTGE